MKCSISKRSIYSYIEIHWFIVTIHLSLQILLIIRVAEQPRGSPTTHHPPLTYRHKKGEMKTVQNKELVERITQNMNLNICSTLSTNQIDSGHFSSNQNAPIKPCDFRELYFGSNMFVMDDFVEYAMTILSANHESVSTNSTNQDVSELLSTNENDAGPVPAITRVTVPPSFKIQQRVPGLLPPGNSKIIRIYQRPIKNCYGNRLKKKTE